MKDGMERGGRGGLGEERTGESEDGYTAVTTHTPHTLHQSARAKTAPRMHTVWGGVPLCEWMPHAAGGARYQLLQQGS